MLGIFWDYWHNVVQGTGLGQYFPTKIKTNRGVLRHLEVPHNISHKNEINPIGPEGTPQRFSFKLLEILIYTVTLSNFVTFPKIQLP